MTSRTACRDHTVWPNPFNAEATIELRIGSPIQGAQLKVYNIAGQLEARLDLGTLPTGVHRFPWSRLAQSAASGSYIIVLESASTTHPVYARVTALR